MSTTRVHEQQARFAEHETARIIEGVRDAVTKFDTRWGDWSGKTVVFIGTTGAGKTTLLHLLAASRLRGVLDNGVSKIAVCLEGDRLPEATIGHGFLAETTIPNRCQLSDGSQPIVYADCPGLHDTAGVPAELRNAVLVQKVFERAVQVKIVLVVSQHDLWGRAAPLQKLVYEVRNLILANIGRIDKSVSLVVSHAEPEIRVEHARRQIDESIQADLIPPAYREFVRGLRERITIFPKPQDVSDGRFLDCTRIRDSVLQNIEASEWGSRLVVIPCFSASAETALRDTHSALQSGVEGKIRAFAGGFVSSVRELAACREDFFSEVERARETQRLRDALRPMEGIFSGGSPQIEWTEAAIRRSVLICADVVRRLGGELPMVDVEQALQKLPSLTYLEGFIPGKAGQSLGMLCQTMTALGMSKGVIEQALVEMTKLDIREKIVEKERLAIELTSRSEAIKQEMAACAQQMEHEQTKIRDGLHRALKEAQQAGCVPDWLKTVFSIAQAVVPIFF